MSDIPTIKTPLGAGAIVPEGKGTSADRRKQENTDKNTDKNTGHDETTADDDRVYQEGDKTTLSIDVFLNALRDEAAKRLNFYDSYDERIADETGDSGVTHETPRNPYAVYQKRAHLSPDFMTPAAEPFPYESYADDARIAPLKIQWDKLQHLKTQGIERIPSEAGAPLLETLDTFLAD